MLLSALEGNDLKDRTVATAIYSNEIKNLSIVSLNITFLSKIFREKLEFTILILSRTNLFGYYRFA